MKRLLAFLITTTLVFSGCSDSDSDGSASGGGESGGTSSASVDKTLRINLAAEPDTLDPSLVDDLPANNAIRGLMEGLVWVDKDMKPQPGVAESWEHDGEYTVWTFNLRQDAKWHNGDPVTAHDFKYAVERVCTPGTSAPYAQIVYDFLEGGKEFYEGGGTTSGMSLDSVKVIDDHTIEYHMAFPAPFFLTMVSFATWLPLNKEAVEAGGETWSTEPGSFVGNGAFKLTEYHSRDKLVMEKADTYWDKGEIFWEKVELYMIDDQNTEASAFRTGSLDVTEGVAIAQLNFWKDKPEYKNVPTLGTYYLIFNTEKEPFDNPLVRKAFSLVIDRNLIVNRVTKGNEIPSDGIVPHGMQSAQEGKTYRDVAPDFVPDPNVEQARALLGEAGYTGENPLPQIEYLYNTADSHKLIGEQLQYMWSEAFEVDVRLQNAEWGVTQDRIIKGNFQFARASWFADYADPLNFLEIFVEGNPKNGPNFNNPRYNELLEKARHSGDPMAREQMFIDAERILVDEECAIAPIFTYVWNYLVQEDIEGVEMNALANLLYVRARRVSE